jgi:hypothetical protein
MRRSRLVCCYVQCYIFGLPGGEACIRSVRFTSICTSLALDAGRPALWPRYCMGTCYTLCV